MPLVRDLGWPAARQARSRASLRFLVWAGGAGGIGQQPRVPESPSHRPSARLRVHHFDGRIRRSSTLAESPHATIDACLIHQNKLVGSDLLRLRLVLRVDRRGLDALRYDSAKESGGYG
jgi:hypothetical protein